MATSSSISSPPSKIPAGKVSCLLCGGFISVAGGDRARFVDHMSNEHDAKTDCQEVLLAVCVFDSKERGFLVKSSVPRLEEIGRGDNPNYDNTFLSKIGTGPPPSTLSKEPVFRHPGAVVPYRRGAQTQRGMVRHTRPQARPQPTAPSPGPPPPTQVCVPPVLQGNINISVSKVDTSRKCNLCRETFPNPAALVEHMNSNHFNNLGGINIITKDDNDAQKLVKLQERQTKQEYPVYNPSSYKKEYPVQNPNSYKSPSSYKKQNLVQSPSSYLVRSPNLNPRILTNSPPVRSNKPTNANSNNIRMITSRNPGVSARQGIRQRNVEIVKCNVCGKSVDKSKLSVHKLSHAKDRKNDKVNIIKTTAKNRSEGNSLKNVANKSALEDEDVELVEIIDDDEPGENNLSESYGDNAVSIASPLPIKSYKQGEVVVDKAEVQCFICDKKLASNMALKMHNNLTHPVKKEIDTEMLLGEETDQPEKDDAIRNEVDKLETLELLDNLVNFLNDA